MSFRYILNLTVHPHARGDDAPMACSTAAAAGSPPRPWGRLFDITKENRHQGGLCVRGARSASNGSGCG